MLYECIQPPRRYIVNFQNLLFNKNGYPKYRGPTVVKQLHF